MCLKCKVSLYINFASVFTIVLFEDYHLIVVRFACPKDPEGYAGGSISSWHGHPCQTDQRVGAR
jgi:hypothetical protein